MVLKVQHMELYLVPTVSMEKQIAQGYMQKFWAFLYERRSIRLHLDFRLISVIEGACLYNYS